MGYSLCSARAGVLSAAAGSLTHPGRDRRPRSPGAARRSPARQATDPFPEHPASRQRALRSQRTSASFCQSDDCCFDSPRSRYAVGPSDRVPPARPIPGWAAPLAISLARRSSPVFRSACNRIWHARRSAWHIGLTEFRAAQQIESMAALTKALDITAAVCALVASVFWFISAKRRLPRQLLYWDGEVPDRDPYLRAIRFAAGMNRWAALFSGLSAASVAVRLFVG
jgi:hypothetical protein